MRSLISIPLLLLVTACADLGYYWDSASGHLAVMQQRVYIDDLLADDSLDAGLRERLALVGEIRRFAVEQLALPTGNSYRSYVDLQRPWVVQNLFAAEEFSTRLQQWCYPVIGCAGYRGYYDEDALRAFADELRAQGLEVHVSPVPAYSTLGWFDDPVLSSFIRWPDYRLAGLLFHELTHQRVFVDGDTVFNESLASAVQQAGTEYWLEQTQRQAQRREYARWLAYRTEVVELILDTRRELARLYASDLPVAQMRRHKARRFDGARAAHEAIASRHGISNGFRYWFAGELNNARFASVAAYNSRVAAFLGMLDGHGGDFDAFFRYVERVAELDRRQRELCLDAWEHGGVEIEPACITTGGA